MAESSMSRVRIRHFARAKRDGIKITALTSYDALTASVFDEAGIDMLLVGDSAGTTVFGDDTTLRVTTDELISLARGVVRGTKRALVVVDMPFGSYENSPDQAFDTAVRIMKETGAHAVKLEGGRRSAPQIKRIVDGGIPVVAHLGFTPQSEHGLGGHVIQGRGAAADALLEDARAVQEAGAFSVVLELVPGTVAEHVTSELSIPTIGIGAGSSTDGQILVWTDFAGLGGGRKLTFVRQYANLRETLLQAAQQYRSDVLDRSFPAADETFKDTPPA